MTSISEQEALGVNGTLIWYYYICKRQVWLMARQLNPDEHDENLEWGRFLHEWRYAREKKELAFENVRLDVVGEREGKLVVAEVKKSSKFRKSAEMQLGPLSIDWTHGIEKITQHNRTFVRNEWV